MNIHDNCIYLDLQKLFYEVCNNKKGILTIMQEIKKAVSNGCAAAVFVISNDKSFNMPDHENKLYFYEKLKELDIITFLICSDFSDIPLEIMLMFDVRLGSAQYTHKKPDDTDKYIFDYNSRMKILLGESNKNIVCVLNDEEKTFTELADRYIKKILGNKDPGQLCALLRCFSHIKQDSIEEAEMLKEESRQFCSLILQQ